jgi:hypothetical protein
VSKTTYDADDLSAAQADGFDDGYYEALVDVSRLLDALLAIGAPTQTTLRDAVDSLQQHALEP